MTAPAIGLTNFPEAVCLSLSRARGMRDMTVPIGIASTAESSSQRSSSTAASSSTSRCSAGRISIRHTRFRNSTRSGRLPLCASCLAATRSPSASSEVFAASRRARARSLWWKLCMIANNHARRSDPALQSLRLSHARSRGSCTKSSARAGLRVRTRAQARSRGIAANSSGCGSAAAEQGTREGIGAVSNRCESVKRTRASKAFHRNAAHVSSVSCAWGATAFTFTYLDGEGAEGTAGARSP
jgi:hypothetical protein